MKNINEQINRMKSLFTEERLFGNLVEQDDKSKKETKCIEGDCVDGKGKKQYFGELEGTYDGEFKNGLRNGQGKWVYGNGRYYIGSFKDDTFDGNGTLYEKDGTIHFKGVFEDDEYYEGEGKIGPKGEFRKITGGESTDDEKKKINLFGKKNENDELKKSEAGCKRIMDRYVRLYEKDPDYLGDVIKNKGLKDSDFNYINYCNTNYGYQFSGNKNILRFLSKLGIEPKLDLPEKTDKKVSLPIVDKKNNKWGTLKREKTFEYSIKGEDGVLIIDRGTLNNDELFTDSLYYDLVSFNQDYKDYGIEDILKNITILDKDENSKKQYIRFKIDI
jgi:hypothetical protein